MSIKLAIPCRKDRHGVRVRKEMAESEGLKVEPINGNTFSVDDLKRKEFQIDDIDRAKLTIGFAALQMNLSDRELCRSFVFELAMFHDLGLHVKPEAEEAMVNDFRATYLPCFRDTARRYRAKLAAMEYMASHIGPESYSEMVKICIKYLHSIPVMQYLELARAKRLTSTKDPVDDKDIKFLNRISAAIRGTRPTKKSFPHIKISNALFGRYWVIETLKNDPVRNRILEDLQNLYNISPEEMHLLRSTGAPKEASKQEVCRQFGIENMKTLEAAVKATNDLIKAHDDLPKGVLNVAGDLQQDPYVYESLPIFEYVENPALIEREMPNSNKLSSGV